MNQSAYSVLNLGSIEPEGWLNNQLILQSQGLTGHLDEFWDSVSKYSGWLGGTGENWERGPYYLDGLLPLAYLLKDKKLISKAEKWVEWSIGSQKPDGNFGPENNPDWWPRMVMLKVLVQYYEATSDDRIISLMSRYFTYLADHIGEKPLSDWGQARGGEFLYSILWLYNRTGEKFLLELAETVFRQTLEWTDFFIDFPFTRPISFYYKWENLVARNSWTEINKLMRFHYTHIVNVTMALKEPGLYYLLSKDNKYRDAIFKGIENLMKYHGQAAGIFSGDEHLSGTDPSQGSELCSVVEYMFSLQILLEITGDASLADILERVAYNALPAAITKDFWGHQYDQQANQVQVTRAKRNWYNNNEDANLFGLEPNFGCCTANMHQGWPKLVKSFWMATIDGGLAALVYAPCTVRTKLAGADVCIHEETGYPFDGIVKFTIENDGMVEFP